MTLREYTSADYPELAALFYETVHAVNAADYTPDQLDAWAPGTVDENAWDASFRAHRTLIAEDQGQIVGFADMDSSGYLDRLYVHRDRQRQGIATLLCDALEQDCRAPKFTTHASITAKPFFAQRGFRVVRPQVVERRGVLLVNYVMEKDNSCR